MLCRPWARVFFLDEFYLLSSLRPVNVQNLKYNPPFPRLALNKNQIVQHVLGITDQNHKNKIVLKAMDVVLFGPPTGIIPYNNNIMHR